MFLKLFFKIPVLFCDTIKPFELLDLLFFVVDDRHLIFCFLDVLSLHFIDCKTSDVPAEYYDKIYLQWAVKESLKMPQTIDDYDQLLKVFSQVSICKFLCFFNFFKIYRIKISTSF